MTWTGENSDSEIGDDEISELVLDHPNNHPQLAIEAAEAPETIGDSTPTNGYEQRWYNAISIRDIFVFLAGVGVLGTGMAVRSAIVPPIVQFARCVNQCLATRGNQVLVP